MAKRSKSFIPRIAQVEKNSSKSLWFIVDNPVNGNPVTLDAIDDHTIPSIPFFFLLDFEMDPLIYFIINVFVMIMVSTNSRGYMKVFVFTDPNSWNSITICSIIPTFCSMTLLDKLSFGVKNQGQMSEKLVGGQLFPGLFISHNSSRKDSSLNHSLPVYSSTDYSSLVYSSLNCSSQTIHH